MFTEEFNRLIIPLQTCNSIFKEEFFMFIGREQELQQLTELKTKKNSSLIVLNGRRRIGKSTLVQEFGKGFRRFYQFQGLAPRPNLNEESQLKNFSEQFSQTFALPQITFTNWTEAFAHLARQIKNEPTLLFLDELSWMAGKNLDFAGKLKIAWDTHFKNKPKLIIALCGSVSSWMERNILQDADFVGRISLVLRLTELDLASSGKFWGDRSKRISSFEKLKLLSVTGGVPKYLEEIDPTQSADQNIRRLCFTKGGYLFEDFERIFNDTFEKRSAIYKKILKELVQTKLSQKELSRKLKLDQGGDLSAYLRDLELSGFVARDYAYFPQGHRSKLSRYRIRDNYLRFYLKYIEPNKDKIEKKLFQFQSLDSLLAWDTIAGIQFENLVLAELPQITKQLQLHQERIIAASPYFQREKSRTHACQIDLLISCKNNTHYVCEIKYQKEIDSRVIREVEEKIKYFQVPRHHTKRPILIYAGHLKQDVIDADYFDKILNFEKFLQ